MDLRLSDCLIVTLDRLLFVGLNELIGVLGSVRALLCGVWDIDGQHVPIRQ